MKALNEIALSMLDLVAVREGGTVADALAIALRTARHAESLGFTRYWLAEHHNMAGVASSRCRCWPRWGWGRTGTRRTERTSASSEP